MDLAPRVQFADNGRLKGLAGCAFRRRQPCRTCRAVLGGTVAAKTWDSSGLVVHVNRTILAVSWWSDGSTHPIYGGSGNEHQNPRMASCLLIPHQRFAMGNL